MYYFPGQDRKTWIFKEEIRDIDHNQQSTNEYELMAKNIADIFWTICTYFFKKETTDFYVFYLFDSIVVYFSPGL